MKPIGSVRLKSHRLSSTEGDNGPLASSASVGLRLMVCCESSESMGE